MAIIGLKYPIAAELTDESGPTYDTGIVIGKGIAANITIEGGEANILYADDAPAESDTSFQGGTIELGIDDLMDAVYAKLLGHTFSDDVIVANVNDQAPYFGVGFYKSRVKSGIRTYRATWIYKVQFSEPADSANTKGETIEWQSPTITGAITALANGTWKTQKTCSSEADAIAFIEAIANIGEPVSKTALITSITTAQSKEPESYTSASYAVMYYKLQLAIAVRDNPDATQAQVDSAKAALDAAITALVEAE